MINKILRIREAWKEITRKYSRPLDRLDKWLFFPVVIIGSMCVSAVCFYRSIIYIYDYRYWLGLQELLVGIFLLWIGWWFIKRFKRGYT